MNILIVDDNAMIQKEKKSALSENDLDLKKTAEKKQPEPSEDSVKADKNVINETCGKIISRYDQTIYSIILTNKLIPQEQLNQILSDFKQKKLSDKTTLLKDILLKSNFISPSLMANLNVATKRQLSKKFGEFIIEKGLIKEKDVNGILEIQANEYKSNKICRMLGDMLLDLGIISSTDLNSAQIEFDPLFYEYSDNNNNTKCEQQNNDGEKKNELSSSETQPAKETDLPDNFQITVSENMLEATIKLVDDLPESVSVDDIKNILKKNMITHKIVDDDVIKNYLQNEAAKQQAFVIARGTAFTPGKDAEIKRYFDMGFLNAGKIVEDGNIDFKDRGEIPHVKKGDLLAEKIPVLQGKEGKDVFGNSIAFPKLNDIKLIRGRGTDISEDRLKLHASSGGIPAITAGGKISVTLKHKIKGDVDFNTGNIDYEGDVIVTGRINEDFSVKANNLYAQSIHDGAKIMAKGNVKVAEGIIGAKIVSEGVVSAKFINKSNIKTVGGVIVTKQVLDSKIRTSGNFLSERGKIISSYVAAKQGIEIKDIGTDVSNPCKIVVGKDELTRKAVDIYENAIKNDKEILEKKQTDFETLENTKKVLQQKITEQVYIQDRATLQKKALTERLKAVHGKENINEKEFLKAKKILEELDLRIKNLDEKVNKYFDKLDKTDSDISTQKTCIEKIIDDIENNNIEKEAIMQLAHEKESISVLTVKGSMLSGTKITGPHSFMIVDKTIKASLVKEIQISETTWNLTIKKLY